jgi:hypothetical protein
MIFDNEEQRGMVLSALMSQPIQGDLAGIVAALPKYLAVVDAVKNATIAEKEKAAIGTAE